MGGYQAVRPHSGFEDVVDLPERPEWQLHAACRGDTAWFNIEEQKTETQSTQIAARQLICHRCKVMTECATQAVEEFAAVATQVRAGVFVPSRTPHDGGSRRRHALVLLKSRAGLT